MFDIVSSSYELCEDIIKEIVGSDIDKLIEEAYELKYTITDASASSYYSVISKVK